MYGAGEFGKTRRLVGRFHYVTRWFTGESAYWADLDEIFLLMEGAGQWATYAWYVDPRGGAVDRETALHELRRAGRYWTQDACLALFLVIDRLLPGWQRLAFARPPVTGTALLSSRGQCLRTPIMSANAIV